MSFIGKRTFRRASRDTGDGWFEPAAPTKRPRMIRRSAFSDWLPFGRTDARHVGSRGLGTETIERFGDTVGHDGRRHGMVRNPNELVKDGNASMHKFVRAGSTVRKAEVRAEAHRGIKSASERVATAPARRQAKEAQTGIIAARVARALDKRKEVESKIGPARESLRAEEKRYDQLPRSERVFFESILIVLLIEVFIVVFDVGVIHDALENSGQSRTTAWMTSIGVPLLVFGANHTFGLIAGAIGLATPPEKRRKLALIAFVAGLTLLMATFVALLVFRGIAGDQMNQSLNDLVNNQSGAELKFLVPMQWLGLAQMAGSIAAIGAVALWTMGRGGREQVKRLSQANAQFVRYEAETKELDAEIEGLLREGEAAQIAAYGVEADRAAATVDMRLREQLLTNQLEAEEGLREAVHARGDLEYEVTEQLYRNGGVRRGAMATTTGRFGRRYTPAPRDIEGVPQDVQGTPPQEHREPAKPSLNGHKPAQPIDPDTVTRVS